MHLLSVPVTAFFNCGPHGQFSLRRRLPVPPAGQQLAKVSPASPAHVGFISSSFPLSAGVVEPEPQGAEQRPLGGGGRPAAVASVWRG